MAAPPAIPPVIQQRITLMLATLALATLPAAVCRAQDCIDYATFIELIGDIDTPGAATDVALAGNRAFVTDGGSGFLTIDITDPAAPWIEGGVFTSDFAFGLALAGDHALVAIGGSGLEVIDITDPAMPHRVGGVDTPGLALTVALNGALACVADGVVGGLQVIDISAPASPVVIAGLDTPGAAWCVAVSGAHAYVADGAAGLQVIDLNEPSSPAIVGAVDVPGSARDVAVMDGHAFVADSNVGLHVIDIADPTSPVIVGTAQYMWSPVRSVAVEGDYAYVTHDLLWGYGGMIVVDVADPTHPVVVGHVDTEGRPWSVAVDGDLACVADFECGLKLVDIENPTRPPRVGHLDEPAARLVAMENGLAIIGNSSELHVVDVADPTSPSILGSMSNGGMDLAVAGGHAYLADMAEGMHVVDLSDPFMPELVGNLPGDIRRVAVAGEMAYLVSGSDAQYFWTVSIAQPSAPVMIWGIDIGGPGSDVDVDGRYAYVSDRVSGLLAIDVLDPATPVVVSSTATAGEAGGVLVRGELAYVRSILTMPTRSHAAESCLPSADRGILEIFDVTDPTSPVLVGSLSLPSGAYYGPVVAGSHAYLPVFSYAVPPSIMVIDISDPSAPWVVGSADWDAANLAVSGEYVYAGSQSSGLAIFPAQCEIVTSVESPTIEAPVVASVTYPSFVLQQNQPNPCNPETSIRFELARRSLVRLEVYNIHGRLYRTLLSGELASGVHRVVWNGRDDRGREAGSGVYAYRLTVNGNSLARKLVLTR